MYFSFIDINQMFYDCCIDNISHTSDSTWQSKQPKRSEAILVANHHCLGNVKNGINF